MKFKVGDKVKIVGKRTDSWGFIRNIFMGEELTIKSVNPNPINRDPHYGVEGKSVVVYEEELELVESGFTKADLKDGMILEKRNGDRGIYIRGVLHCKVGFNDIESNWDDELKNIDGICIGQDIDIVKVYEVKSRAGGSVEGLLTSTNNLTLIWERKEEPEYKEMTVEEIEKELGYKVKVVGNE